MIELVSFQTNKMVKQRLTAGVCNIHTLIVFKEKNSQSIATMKLFLNLLLFFGNLWLNLTLSHFLEKITMSLIQPSSPTQIGQLYFYDQVPNYWK